MFLLDLLLVFCFLVLFLCFGSVCMFCVFRVLLVVLLLLLFDLLLVLGFVVFFRICFRVRA